MANDITINLATEGIKLATPIKLLILLTLLSLAPSLLIMFTTFVRIVIVLALVRQAIGNSNNSTEPGNYLLGFVSDLLHNVSDISKNLQRCFCSVCKKRNYRPGVFKKSFPTDKEVYALQHTKKLSKSLYGYGKYPPKG